MPAETKGDSQHPLERPRCLAGPSGNWAPGRIRHVDQGGTFTVELDEKEMIVLPYWYGVTADQISIDDEALWPGVFARLAPDPSGMTKAAFAEALSTFYRLDDDSVYALWVQQCKHLFGMEIEAADDSALNQQQAYQLFVQAGCSAKHFMLAEAGEQDYFKLYWNQVRMGGRQPGEVKRPVTLDDAFEALGVLRADVDQASQHRIDRFQEEAGVVLPAILNRFLCRAGVEDAVFASHPNAPGLVLPGDEDSSFRRDPPLKETHADCALTMMVPHQGGHVWTAVFNEGDAEPRVYVTWGNEQWLLTAPTIGMFFWDLAQTGLTWFRNKDREGGRPLEKTDIGVAPVYR